MSRLGLIVLMTTALLYCPYRCTAISAVASAHDQATSACACCAKKCRVGGYDVQAQTGQPTEHPTNDDGSGSCICDGAIAAVQKVVASESVGWTAYVGPLASHDLSARDSIEQFARPPNRIDAGKSLRVAMRSLQL